MSNDQLISKNSIYFSLLFSYIAASIFFGGFFHEYFGDTWLKGCFIGFIIGGLIFFLLGKPIVEMWMTLKRINKTKSNIRELDPIVSKIKSGESSHEEQLQAAFDLKYLINQRELEKAFLPDFFSMFYINIWDEYDQQGRTFAYVEENDLPDKFTHSLLEWLQPKVQSLLNDRIQVSLDFFDGSRVYSKLLGGAGEWSIYKRWQLGFTSLPDETRLMLISRLNAMQLSFNGVPLKFISES